MRTSAAGVTRFLTLAPVSLASLVLLQIHGRFVALISALYPNGSPNNLFSRSLGLFRQLDQGYEVRWASTADRTGLIPTELSGQD